MSERALKVATDALREDAAVWRRHSQMMDGIVRDISGMSYNIFQHATLSGAMSTYTEIKAFIYSRCFEGSRQFTAIASTLEIIAHKYETNEQARKRQLELLK